MYKEFLYEEPESENPYEMIERGISLYGDEHWKSMDDAEFEMHYGIPKREFLHNYSIEYSFYTREKVDFADDYSPLNMEEFMKEFKETAESHRNAPKIVQENSGGAPAGENKAQKGQAPPAKNTPAPQSTSASPKAGKKRNKPNTPRKAKSSASPLQEAARKEFNAFKRGLIKSTRGSLGRTRINLMEKALKAAMDKAGIKWGTPEWAGLVRKFFPGADFAALSKAETPPAPTAEGTKTAPAKKEGTPTQDTVAQSPAEAQNDAEAEAKTASTQATAPAPTEPSAGGMSEGKTGEEQQAPEEGKKEEGPQKGNTDQQKAAKEQIKQAVKAVKGPGGPGKSAKEEKTAAAGGKSSAPAPPAGGGGPLKINKPEDTGAKVSATQAKTDALEKAGDVLNRESESALKEKTEKIAKTSAGQRETKSAEEKRAEAEKAVEPPVEEAVSEANTGTIEVVDEAPEPEVDPAEQKQSVSNKMRDALPKTADEVKKLDKENPARKASQEMNQLVKEQTAGVKNTFNKIEDTPTPQPKSAEAPLPGPEPAVQQEALNLSEGMLPPSDPGQSDFSEYTQASDDLVANELQNPELVKEFETSDATPMVEAREARDGIREEAEAAPQEVKDIEQAEQDNLDKALGDEEKKATEEMANARKQGLEESTGTQQEKKTEFEQEKLRVSEHINKIYERTNDHIKTKLELLETQTMKAFEEGQKAAMETFDNTVDEELEEFFEERHSGIGGFFTAIGDWFSGTDDLPEVQEIFERNRVIYVETIDRLIEDLSANTEQVIEECKQILADAKEEIKEYVEGLDGKLKEFGEQCQDDIDQKLKKLSEDIEQKEKEMADKLAEEREKAIEAVDKRIEERKESMKSGLAKLGSMLLDLAIKFFTFTLTSLGMNPDEIMAMINKGVETLTLIVTDPKQFFSNLGGAVKQGLGQFQANFMKHMIGGMIEWLTGAMGGTVEIPTEFSFKGIFKMGMSILGLTWPSIRMKLVKHLGETIVTAAEKGFEIVTVLITEGPMGLWEWIKQEAATIKDTIIDSIKDWALTAIVKSAVTQLALMCNPVGAIVRAIIAIYDLVMWLVDNIQRIISFVNSVVDSVAAIAAGQISGAANYIESSIARTIPMILSGLAQFLKLNGIAKKIQQAIEKVRKPIDNAIDKGIGFVVGKVKGWFKGKKGKKGDAKKIKDENKKDKAEELDAKDKAKHKEIGGKIKKSLQKTEGKDIVDMQKKVDRKAEDLEDQYQPQLKKGINLDVKVESANKALKDGNVSINITIKPNNYDLTFDISDDEKELDPEDQARFKRLLYAALELVASKSEDGGMYEGGSSTEFDEARKNNLDSNDLSPEKQRKESEQEKKLKEKKDEEDQKLMKESKNVHDKIAITQNKYRRASKAKHVPSNTFNEGSGDFFVETASNYYIVPTSRGMSEYFYTLGRTESLTKILLNAEEKVNQIDGLSSEKKSKLKRLNKQQRQMSSSSNEAVKAKLVEINKDISILENEKINADKNKKEDLEKLEEMRNKNPKGDTGYEIIKFIKKNSLKTTNYLSKFSNENMSISVGDLAGEYQYHTFPLSPEEAKIWYKTYPAKISSSGESVLFLANLLAEPARWSVSHITNMLLLNEDSNLSDKSEAPKRELVEEDKKIMQKENYKSTGVYEHTSMSQRGSDPNKDTATEYSKDENMRFTDEKHLPKNVTDRDLAAIKRNEKLKQNLEDYYKSVKKLSKKPSDQDIIKEFAEKIKTHLLKDK